MLEDREYTQQQLREAGFDPFAYRSPARTGTYRATLEGKAWGTGKASEALICYFTLDDGTKLHGFTWPHGKEGDLGARDIKVGSPVEITYVATPRSNRIVLERIDLRPDEANRKLSTYTFHDPSLGGWSDGTGPLELDDNFFYDSVIKKIAEPSLRFEPSTALGTEQSPDEHLTIFRFTFKHEETNAESIYETRHQSRRSAMRAFIEAVSRLEEVGPGEALNFGFAPGEDLEIDVCDSQGEIVGTYALRINPSIEADRMDIPLYGLRHTCWKCGCPMTIPTYVNRETRLEPLQFPWDKPLIRSDMTAAQNLRHVLHDSSIEHYPISVLGQNDELDELICEQFPAHAEAARLKTVMTKMMPGLPYKAAHCPSCAMVQGWNPSVYVPVNHAIKDNIALETLGILKVSRNTGPGRTVDETLKHVSKRSRF